ncbi:MAG: ABC transporter ATP-binding protein [Proteobacteria bacterium]|nr:ABC transporter ATP-binding protein [Pseudomonadota bacterium]
MLKISNLRVHYGNTPALKGDVSLEVSEKEIVTILGANGAGKSTLLRCISGLIRAKAGDVEFMNRRINRLSPYAIVKMGIAHVPEGRKVYPQMSVADNLEMGAYTRKNKARVQETLESVLAHFPILGERGDQMAGTLSGGEQQMLAIGRGLMADPKLLILDEPSLGLAPLVVKEIGHIVLDINRMGTTILLVEQNSRMALQLAHRGYVMETGRIALSGLAKDLLTDEHVKKAYLGG